MWNWQRPRTATASHRLRRSSSLVILFACLTAAAAQDLPDKIRGYKLYKTEVSINGPPAAGGNSRGAAAEVKLGKIDTVDVGLTGATFEIGGEISSLERSGKVDFLMFRDFRVNGIPVDIEEYTHPFKFTKHRPTRLPEPVRISIFITDLPGALYKEMLGSPDELPVKGTVLVFGRFKKMGIEFKRVIPVPIDLKIRNPLHG